MRRHYSTTDKKTGKELILSDASYNASCAWIEAEVRKAGGEVTRCYTDWKQDMTVIETSERKFFYDESRGYLLGE